MFCRRRAARAPRGEKDKSRHRSKMTSVFLRKERERKNERYRFVSKTQNINKCVAAGEQRARLEARREGASN